ncbi:MAG: hypothetical protein JW895_13195 [Thermoleophilaceae bacterium]|nr:hypothetical protein [Thermoleophilaceae bacterium]
MLIGAPKAPKWLSRDWSPADGRDVYLTDGLRLFRLIETVALGHGPSARLEDCYTLREELHTRDELWRMQLHTVRRTAPAA